MSDASMRAVTIDQPVANKMTVFALAAIAAFVAMVFASNIDAALFQAALVGFAIATGLYAFRAIRVSAIADAGGITVTNLRRTIHHPWTTVEALTVGPLERGPGVGITVDLRNGSSIPVEASWGAWYEGKRGAANRVRCERYVDAITSMRTQRPPEAPAPTELADPIEIRPMTPDDADAAAKTLSAAWKETYGELLTNDALYDRDLAEDAAMLTQLTSDDIPRAGCLVAERYGTIVGLSVYGPPESRELALDGYIEIYLIFVLDAEQADRTGPRLTLRTVSALRHAGARGVAVNVHAGLRSLRRRLEVAGMTPSQESNEQIWYGLPVKVVQYRRPLKPLPVAHGEYASGPQYLPDPGARIHERGRVQLRPRRRTQRRRRSSRVGQQR